MQGVLDLPGFADTSRRKPPRTYFCLLPDAATATALEALTGRLLRGEGRAWMRMDRPRMHLSLHPVARAFRVRRSVLYAATEAARRVVVPGFEIRCREAVGFPPLGGRQDRCPLVLRAESVGVQELHGKLGAAMARWGLRPAGGIAPHITLARGPRVLPPSAIEPIRFAVSDFALVRSGDTYDVIERFPLRG